MPPGNEPAPRRNFVGLAVAGAGLASLAALIALGPITKDPTSGQFADQRTLCGIPRFGDVSSNLFLLLAGVAGLWAMAKRRAPAEYVVFFVGVALAGLGSTWYHLDPVPARLFWDRLPMTLSFAALFAAVIRERTGARLLWPLAAAGMASVWYWRQTGDLSLYAWIQYFPILAIPVLLVACPARQKRPVNYWILLVIYALAKVFEYYDAPVLELTRIASGHTLKHCLAGLAAGVYAKEAWTTLKASSARPDESASEASRAA